MYILRACWCRLHGFELVDTFFRVSCADLFKSLVLVASLLDVLCVQLVVPRRLRLVLPVLQLSLQLLGKTKVLAWLQIQVVLYMKMMQILKSIELFRKDGQLQSNSYFE